MAELDKDAFFSTVIHELRAPLNACLMSVNLLELKASDRDEVLRCVEVLRRNLDRQARLIQDLADVLQIAAGGIELDAAPVDLSELVDDAVERYRHGSEHKVAVEWPGGPDIVVEADVDRLARVLDALIDHQAAAAGPGDTVEIGLEETGAAARLTVRRAAAGTADTADGVIRDQKGFAVRLAVAEQVVDAHGGRLSRTDAASVMELSRSGQG